MALVSTMPSGSTSGHFVAGSSECRKMDRNHGETSQLRSFTALHSCTWCTAGPAAGRPAPGAAPQPQGPTQWPPGHTPSHMLHSSICAPALQHPVQASGSHAVHSIWAVVPCGYSTAAAARLSLVHHNLDTALQFHRRISVRVCNSRTIVSTAKLWPCQAQ